MRKKRKKISAKNTQNGKNVPLRELHFTAIFRGFGGMGSMVGGGGKGWGYVAGGGWRGHVAGCGGVWQR